MRPVTFAVQKDEKAWALRELNLVFSGKRHRWQIVTVIRNDRLTEWWHDLGESTAFTAPELEIPGLLEHTVAELRDLAEGERLGADYWIKRQHELAAASTIIPDMVNQLEERSRIINNRSQFGPVMAKPRNGFDRKAALEQPGN